MSFVPRSLFSRLVLVLLGGLVLAQTLSLALHAHERGQMLAEASGMQSAQRIADIVRILEPLTPADRQRLAAVFSAPPLAVRLGGAPQTAGADMRAAIFASLIERFLGDDRAVSVASIETPRWRGGPPMPTYAPHGMHGPWALDAGGPAPGLHGGIAFIAQVRLHDGTLVTFDSRQAPETLSWPYRLLGSLVILLAAVIGLSLVAVRWATRPLALLADAADEFGRDIERPPLDEAGPTEVRRAARAFNTMQARLLAYLRDRTRVLAAMSHDLKTPITRLRLRAELLDDAALRAKFTHDLEEMEAMVEGTLDFMRGLESDEPSQPIDVNALVQSIEADARETGGAVSSEGAAGAPYVGRPRALRRCLANLVGNAVKYGGRAHVVVDDDAQRLRICVRDEGPGIPAAAIERVFEPFYRLEPSRSRETGGAGLGLWIARAIAERHGGTLSLVNREPRGLEARLTLPRSSEQHPPQQRRHEHDERHARS